MTKRVRVAAVQCTSLIGAGERNLENASGFVRDAAERGAGLILCPEFLAAGYIYEETIWDAGEPATTGRTERWLADHASELGALVGATYLEAEDDDFYNTFALYGPDGVVGRVRKQALPAFEGWYFRPCPRPKVIETPLGRVGVGICQDNHTRRFLDHVTGLRPDLILMPHSAPSIDLPLGPLGAKLFDRQLDAIAPRFAEALGVPVVLSNKVSLTPFRMPIPIAPRIRVPMRFHGYSRIVDGDGVSKARLVDREGALVADVTLDAARKRTPEVPESGYWSFGPGLLSAPVGRLLETLDAMGQRRYRENPRRAARARSAATRSVG